MTDTNGAPAGISVDLARALGKSLGRPVRIENLSFAGLIPALKTGKIDLIISSMTATPERAQSIALADASLAEIDEGGDLDAAEDARADLNYVTDYTLAPEDAERWVVAGAC